MNRFLRRNLKTLLLLFFVGTNVAFGEELPKVNDSDLSHAVYSQGASTIPGLTWAGEDGKPSFSIEALPSGGPAARVAGKFEGKNTGTLFFVSKSTQRAKFTNEEGNFSVLIPLTDRKTLVTVQYIDDYGNLKTQELEIIYENFFQFQLNPPSKKKVFFDVGASLSYLDFSQTAATTNVKITELGVTTKGGITWNLGSRLDLGTSAFVTLIPLPLSKSDAALSTPRFYGVNLRIGYKVYSMKTGNIYLMTGPYFWGMIVPPSDNGQTYGVVRLTGPQLFLVGRFLTGSGRTVAGYLKWASILDGDGGMSQNREYAIGGAYQITPPKAKRRFMANLDFASASFIVNTESIQLNSLSLGISTNF